MYTDRKKRKTALIAGALVCCVVLLACFLHFGNSGKDLTEESAGAIEEAIRRAALQCYAVEGAYPPNLDYLRENYGLQINTDDFYVTYEAFSPNQPPTHIVTPKH